MKLIQALFVALVISFSGKAQILALDSAAGGGFEAGATFAANGWIAVNPGTPIHQWVLDNIAPAQSGARGAHVSNNGSAYAYTPAAGGTRACHLYTDVTIPAGSVSIKLKFYWKGQGDLTPTARDLMFVSTAPTSLTPVANTPVSPLTTLGGTATTVWTQATLSTTYTAVTVALPSSLAGTTFRLIFTWINDATAGSGVPAALDNVSVQYNCGMPAAITGVPTVCEGSTTGLFDGSPGGTWASSNPAVGTISPSGVVAGITQGTTTISYTTTCASPATMVVSVLAAPSPIGGPSSVCVGSSITLTDTALSGGWSSVFSSIASINSVTGVVNGLVPGVDTIKYTNGCGSTVWKLITVNPNPPAITGPGHVCETGAVSTTITLSNASLGGTWSTVSPAFISATTSGPGTGLITGIADGTGTVVYTSTLNCLVTTIVTIDPMPNPILGVAPICVGGSLPLTNSLPGGVWSSTLTGIATISSTGGLMGLVAGTTTISYTNGCGAATVIVTVDGLPTPIIGPDSMCVGNTATFADAVIGGTWSSSFPTIATVLIGSGLLTAVSPGVSFITYTMPGGCYATRNIYVVNPAAPITGTMSLCPGTSVTLSNPTIGGAWLSLSPGSASVTASGVVLGIHPDIVTIQYTTPVGCVAYASVTVNPVPLDIIADSEYCAANMDTLYDASPLGTWSSVTPGIATINSSTGVMTAVAGGVGTIKYTLPTGCFTTRAFTVHPLPVPVVTFNWSINSFETGTGYSTYQWYHSVFGKVVGATLYRTAGIFNGSYRVVVTDSNGCENTSAPVAYATWMGIGGIVAPADVHVYPNPATDVVYIDAGNNVKAIISSMDGKTLIEQDNVKNINIARLPAGIYMLSLYDQAGVKILVEKLTKQ